jgi:hypothetical protein
VSQDRPSAGPSPDARSRARMAISELFLDTALDEKDFARLRDELRSSGLSLRELDEIYYDEVAPLLYQNLNSPAGVWSGFDGAWLDGEIQKRRPPRGFAPLASLRRFLATRSTIKDWNRLRAMIA